jgi:hypothetical protein
MSQATPGYLRQTTNPYSFLRVMGQLGDDRWGDSDKKQQTTIKNEHACSFLIAVGW